mmetsp:Transcript_43509/g.137620  ORF Transcript_43509/g.137620 Transcript_43509/m.137620 type:complete len:539 (-) Transcript_43509:312-1928(-)
MSMKGSCLECAFCKSTDLKVNRANETIQCETCDHILEERYNDYRVTNINFERESPYCAVVNDSLAKHKFDSNVEGDPFHAAGFITAFSQVSLQQQGAFTLTARTFPGDLAELERLLHDLDVDCPVSAKQQQAAAALTGVKPKSKKDSGGYAKLRYILVAYFELLDVGEMMGIKRVDIDEALRLFKQFVDASSNLRSKNVESLAIASLVLVMRKADRARDLPEFAAASGLLQKDLIQGIKAVQQALDSSSMSSTASVSSHMPQFCRVLGMQGQAEQLAITIGENATTHNVCTRRNPISIAAAAIYLACNLEDQKKTQTEICKVTGLTEVTLRKVYKELLQEHDKLIPSTYIAKVRLQTLLPLSLTGPRPYKHVPCALDKKGCYVSMPIPPAGAVAGAPEGMDPNSPFLASFFHRGMPPFYGQIPHDQMNQQMMQMGMDASQVGKLPHQPNMFAPGLNPFQNSLFAMPHPPGKPGEQAPIANNGVANVPPPPFGMRSFQQILEQNRQQNQSRGNTMLKNDHAARGSFGESMFDMLKRLTW